MRVLSDYLMKMMKKFYPRTQNSVVSNNVSPGISGMSCDNLCATSLMATRRATRGHLMHLQT